MRKFLVLFCYAFLFLSSCVDPYNPPKVPVDRGLLVVDGFINSDGPTSIQLSHTLSIGDKKTKPPAELKASVFVERDDNTRYALAEKGTGLYSIATIPIDYKRKYRLRINTVDKKEYVSDFVEVARTPAIDAVTWEIDEVKRGIQFYVNTHDPENATRYYTWDYVETYQYHSDLTTSWDYINGRILERTSLSEKIYTCWNIRNSTAIYSATTDKLQQDLVYQFPLLFIPANSPKMEIGYHLRVKQYGVTRETYEYLSELKMSTEQQGSLFDTPPSPLAGNVHCVSDENEPVLGNVSAHGASEKNVFIARQTLPGWFSGRTADSSCPISQVGFEADFIAQMLRAGTLVPANDPETNEITYQPKSCVDCRVAGGGVNVKPAYWPN